MNTATATLTLARLSGSVERITFHNETNGFYVLRVKVKGQRDLVTVLANAASIGPGEYIECSGQWVNDKKHGLQFKAEQLVVVPPTTLDGIEQYLGSGMMKGIGPHLAQKLIEKFGENVLEVIAHEPKKLLKVPGMGKKRQQGIIAAWGEQKNIRDIMLFLQSYGVSTSRAVRIYKTYGEKAIEKVRENPYCLALDIRGIGFKTADELALRLGIATDSLMRAQAGVQHVLQELCNHGHCAAPLDKLVNASVDLLAIPAPIIKEAIKHEIAHDRLASEFINNEVCIFPIALYCAELSTTQHLWRLLQGVTPWGEMDIEKVIPWAEEKAGIQLAPSQQQAIATVLKNKVTIITGGPGVGKTTIVNTLLKILHANRLQVALCAPTGRAAKRLTETTGMTAKTIHRLLEIDPQTFLFKCDENNPLPLDVLVVDEASMIDIVLFNSLLKAIPSHAALLIVGDVDQLPSVGPGAVLADLINSEKIPTVRLTEIFRQAANSKIIVNAHRIHRGELPLVHNTAADDFYMIYAETPEAIHEQITSLICERIPNFLNCDPLLDIQILTPMHRGGLGTIALNEALQKQLNPQPAASMPTRFGRTFAPGDKVMQNVNNYDKEIFNGDIGLIERIDLHDNSVHVAFDNRVIVYSFDELDELNLAYAISIHKSQGSEFPVIIIPLVTQHYQLLARNLLYTGITRGKRLVILLGQKQAIRIAVENNRAAERLTKLKWRLNNE